MEDPVGTICKLNFHTPKFTVLHFDDFLYPSIEISCNLYVSASKVINNSLRGWCSVYECSDETSFTSGILIIIAATIFSPWTFVDGTLGALLSQAVSGK